MELIQQREPVVMIDRLLSVSESSARSEFKIERNNIFVDKNEFSEGGLIENMAQTAAAGSGWFCRKKDVELPLNYLGAISNFKIYKHPLTGQIIETATEIKASALNITLLKAQVFLKNELIAECEMKVVTADPAASGLY